MAKVETNGGYRASEDFVFDNSRVEVEPNKYTLKQFASVLIGVASTFDASIKPSKQFDAMVEFGRQIGSSTTFVNYREDILRLMGSVIAKSKHTKSGSRATILCNFHEAIKDLRVPNEVKRLIKGEITFIGTLLTLLNGVKKDEELELTVISE